MKILIAGSSGAIGQPLVDLLISEGHDVYGITQSKERAKILEAKKAKPLILDVLDGEAVLNTVKNIQPDVVIDMLTRLPKEYTPESMRQYAEIDAKLRLEGGAHLYNAAETCGASRFIAQSSAFWYESGSGLADEKTSLAFEASPGVVSGVQVYDIRLGVHLKIK